MLGRFINLWLALGYANTSRVTLEWLGFPNTQDMAHSLDDTNAFHDFEYDGWQQSTEQYDYSFKSLTSQTIEPLLDSVNARGKMKVLDIASGPGYVAHRAYQRGCKVVGIDFADAMVAKAKAKYPEIDFIQGEAERIPFNDCEFEAVVINFGLLHFSRPDKALLQAFRVLKRKRRLGFTVWSKPEEAIAFRILLQTIDTCGKTEVGLPNGPPFFQYSNIDSCTLALKTAGFSNIGVKTIPMKWQLSGCDEFFNAFYKGSARNGGLLRAQTPQALKAIQDTLIERLSDYIQGNKLILPMSSILAFAQKP